MSASHYICPGCGEEIPVSPAGCPRCTRTPKPKKRQKPKPWEQDETHDGLDLDLPEDDTFDYDKFIAEEFGAPPKRTPKQLVWAITALILVGTLLYLALH